jgi:predicted nucleic acid-binding Zn ribbon protein
MFEFCGQVGILAAMFQRPLSQERRAVTSARRRVLAQWRRSDWPGEEEPTNSPAKSAQQVVPKVLTDLRLEQRLAEREILRVWNRQLDPNVAVHAQPTGLHKGTLFVSVDSSAWLNEIVRYRRREILERLQNSFGRELIARISFRAG